MEKLFELYKKMLEIHIKTKTVCPLFHEKTADSYILLFEAFHEIAEKMQDTEEADPIVNLDKAKKEAYDIIEEAKDMLEEMVAEKQTVGMDNLLRGLVDKMETECGKLRGFVKEEEYEEEEETDEAP